MSRWSYHSLQQEKRLTKHRVTDEDLFDYVLRVALLGHLTQPKVAEPKPPVMDSREREHSSRLSALSNFSIGDIFRDVAGGNSKSTKFPEKLLKILEQKLQDVALGKDAMYSDQLVRRTMAKFYGQFMIESFKKQMKENRKIEELILMFATHSTSVLKKEPTLAGDGWKLELNNQIALFIRLLRECLRSVNHVSPELLSRLDTYTAKLAPTLNVSTKPSASGYSDSGYDSASTRGDRDSASASSAVGMNVADMTLVKVVAALFKIPEDAIQQEVDKIRGSTVTEKAAIADLKTCLKNIASGLCFPGQREDFETESAWQHWRASETAQLQQLIVVMLQTNPELAKSTSSDLYSSLQSPSSTRPASHYLPESPTASRHGSIRSRKSYYGANGHQEYPDDDEDSSSFTFIPPNPKKYYKRLVEYCLTADLEIMLSPEVDDNDEVSLGILSAPHIDLINECALRWRIGHPYRAACFLDLVRQFYERNDVPMECVPEALQAVAKVIHDTELELWFTQDVDYLANVHAGLFNIFLSSLYHAMDSLPALKPSEIEAFLSILEHVQSSGLLARFDIDIEARMHDVKDRIRQVSAHWFEGVLHEKQSAPGVNRALPLLFMTDDIEKSAKALDKKFPEPLLGKLDLVSLFVEVVVPRFIGTTQQSQKKLFESSMNGPTPDVPIQDIFALYRRSKTMMKMYRAFASDGTFQFRITEFFEQYVRQWLINTDDKTKNWVDAAISHDKFEAESVEGHSSSIMDLFDSLRSPINFLQELEWEDEYQEARFFTSLARTISKAVEQYCRSVEGLFLSEMYPRPSEFLQPQKSSAWLEKARHMAILTGEKRVEPFNFLPQSCVKLNNIEGARALLDKMYTQMQADKLAEVLINSAPPVPEKKEKDRFLFSVKIAIAEGLVPLDSSPSSKLDSFVTLNDEQGNRLAKTRTIYESLNPRWEETFDLSVDKPLWLAVSVRDRALVGKHDIVGRAYLCLDPRKFNDYFAHDIWSDLDTQGRILLRVSMEGEKDDIQFYFGRAFRSLKRAEGDMLRIFIDKMSPFIEQCLSRSVLKALIKSKEPGMDYNKALAALYRSAVGPSSSEPLIPPTEKPRVRPEDLTDVEIEQAILPLFDYFDANLQTLNTHLSETAKQMVMGRVWKEILNIIEGLLIPPLSDVSSDMKPLSDKEVDIAFRWLKFLKDYFYANGEGPVPLEMLQNQKYREVLSIRLYYDWHTDALMEECVRMMQQTFRDTPSIKKRAKTVYAQRNLGTIKERRKEKRQETETRSTSELTIMRILRMRPRTQEFIGHQLHIMATMQAEQEKNAREAEERKAKRLVSRQQQMKEQQIPPLPLLPDKVM